MKRIRVIVVAAAALAAFSACDKRQGEPAAKGPAVAVLAGSSITVERYQKKLAELPPAIQARYSTLERKKEFLDNLIRSEVLLAEAKKRGLEQDPEVRSTLDKILVQRLWKLEMDEFDKKNAPSDADLKAFYEEHKSEFVKPERVRVSHVFFTAGAAGAPRDRVKAEAQKALAETKSKESGANKTAFAQLARARSDDERTKSLDGDLGLHTREELTGLWGQPFADAAFSLKSPNDIGELVAGERGFHIVKLIARQPGFERSLENAKGPIQSRLLMERRSRFMDEFVAELKRKSNVSINEEALKSITVASMPTMPSMPSMPSMPGMPGMPGMPTMPTPPIPKESPAPH
jgi:peptidyl-prolyl cis-trans isomerase C